MVDAAKDRNERNGNADQPDQNDREDQTPFVHQAMVVQRFVDGPISVRAEGSRCRKRENEKINY